MSRAAPNAADAPAGLLGAGPPAPRDSASAGPSRGSRFRRVGLWTALVVLLLAAQLLSLLLTMHYRTSRAQSDVDEHVQAAASAIEQAFDGDLRAVLALPRSNAGSDEWRRRADELLLARG